MTTPDNDEGHPKAAPVDGLQDDHPDSARQHAPRSRDRSRQRGPVDLTRTIGAALVAARRAGRFEWERAVRSEAVVVLPGEVKATLFTLATWTDAEGAGAFPSQATIGRAIGKAERTIRDHLRLAVESGWLARSRRGNGRTTRYFLTVPDRQPVAGLGENHDADGEPDNRQPTAGKTGSELDNRQPTTGNTGGSPPPITTDTSPEETPSASPISDHLDQKEETRDAVAREARSGSTKEEGSMTLHHVPAAEDQALRARLREIPHGPLRARVENEWRSGDGGRETLRANVERATLGDGLDHNRLARFLDETPTAFTVSWGWPFDDGDEVTFATYDEAAAEIARRRTSGFDNVALEVSTGVSATFRLGGKVA